MAISKKTLQPKSDVQLYRKNNVAERKYFEGEHEDHILAYDDEGNEYFITKDEWKNNILPETIASQWDNADGLFSVIYQAIDDHLPFEVLAASERLLEIDSQSERSFAMRGIVLKLTGQAEKAKQVFLDYLENYGPSTIILTNLGQLLINSNKVEAKHHMFQAAKLNPNYDLAVQGYALLSKTLEGEQGYLKALEELTSFESSWLPQLFITKYWLSKKKIDKAKQYADYVLQHSNDLSYALWSLSGDLGKNGYLYELVKWIAPRYKPTSHSALIGINLLKTYLELNRKSDGLSLLYTMKQIFQDDPPILNHLSLYFHDFTGLK